MICDESFSVSDFLYAEKYFFLHCSVDFGKNIAVKKIKLTLINVDAKTWTIIDAE